MERAISLLATLATFIICIIWWCRHPNEWEEPVIGIIASFIALCSQGYGLYLRLKKHKTILEAPITHGQNPRSISGSVDFAVDKYEFTIRPVESLDRFWRAGFKLSNIGSINLDHLEQGTALFTVEQTAHSLTCSFHENSQRVNGLIEVHSNYKNEKVTLLYKEIGATIHFEVKIGNKIVHHQDVSSNYRYGKFLAFGDGHAYKLAVTERNMSR